MIIVFTEDVQRRLLKARNYTDEQFSSIDTRFMQIPISFFNHRLQYLETHIDEVYKLRKVNKNFTPNANDEEGFIPE
jgi:hypothetical protein